MIIINQLENSVFSGDNFIIDMTHDAENKRYLITLITSAGVKFNMAQYDNGDIAKIALKKFIEAKTRDEKIFKFLVTKDQEEKIKREKINFRKSF
jgi:hypothetical protein